MFGQFRSDFLPYCLHQIRKDIYVILNREYKPLGLITHDFVEYEDYAVQIKGITRLKASKLSARGSDDQSRIYLYNDGCKPEASPEHARAYFKRLRMLFKLKTTPIDPALRSSWKAPANCKTFESTGTQSRPRRRSTPKAVLY